MATRELTVTLKVREDTAANWASKNPVLASGEFGYDKTNKILKIGDGVNTWANLAQVNGGGGSSVTIVQATGTSTTSVMSQSAVTTYLGKKQNLFTTSGTSRDVNMTPYSAYAKTSNVLRNIKLNGSFYTVNFDYKALSTPYHVATSPSTTVTTINLSSIIPSGEYLSTGLYEIDLYIQMYSSSGSETKLWLWSDYYNAEKAAELTDEYKIAATSNYGRMQCVQLKIPARTYIKYSASKTFGDFYLTVCGYRRIE